MKTVKVFHVDFPNKLGDIERWVDTDVLVRWADDTAEWIGQQWLRVWDDSEDSDRLSIYMMKQTKVFSSRS
jgi:hypothetical protein